LNHVFRFQPKRRRSLNPSLVCGKVSRAKCILCGARVIPNGSKPKGLSALVHPSPTRPARRAALRRRHLL
jgi:hypothetical protein